MESRWALTIRTHRITYRFSELESWIAEKYFSKNLIILFSLIGWRWKEVKNNLAVMGFILLSGLAKLAFHRAHVISSKVPESCLLVILGVMFGGLLYPFYKDECSDNQKCLDYDDLGKMSQPKYFLFENAFSYLRILLIDNFLLS